LEKYFNSSVAIISFFGGILCFILAQLFVNSYLAAHIALLFSLLILVVLPIVLYQRDKKYRGFESTIHGLIRLRVNSNCYFEGSVRNGNLYALNDMLCYVCFDHKPYIMVKLPFSEIRAITLLSKPKMRIACTDGRVLDFVSQDINAMFHHLEMSLNDKMKFPSL